MNNNDSSVLKNAAEGRLKPPKHASIKMHMTHINTFDCRWSNVLILKAKGHDTKWM